MAITPELEAHILRYFHVEKWRVGAIARQLGVHHGTVDRVLSQAGLPKVQRSRRASLIDPYLPFVVETLGGMRKAVWSAQSAMSARPSSPHANQKAEKKTIPKS